MSPFPRGARLDAHGRLRTVGGVDVEELADRCGTPLYVLDHAELVGRMRAYREAFDGRATIIYAAKALCVTGVLQLASAEGLHVDVASGGELHTALRARLSPERLVLHGNNKSVAELEHAVAAGVGRIVLDSFTELERLEAVAERAGRVVDVLVRVTPGIETSTHHFVRTGHEDTKFGFTLSAGLALRAVAQVARSPHLRLRGLHSHVGSQVLSLDAFATNARILCDALARCRDRLGVEVEELNLGGGLGIRYTDEDAVEPARYAQALLQGVDERLARLGLTAPRLAVEPGRSVVGPAGLTLYRVGTVKDIPNVRRYVSVDGGMSDNLRPALYGARYQFAAAGDGDIGGTALATVVGKHCESGDVLGADVELPEAMVPGDLLAVAATGAYNHAMASNYNRLPRPAMVLVRDGGVRTLLERETLDDVIGRDVMLADDWLA